MSVRLKILLVVALVLAVALGLHGWLDTLDAERIYRDETERRGRALLAALAVPTTIAVAGDEVEVLDDYIALVGADRDGDLDILYVFMLDHDGRVLAHTNLEQYGRQYDDAFFRVEEPVARQRRGPDGTPVLEVAQPLHSGLRWGTLVAGFSLRRMNLALERTQRQNAVFTAGLVLLSCLILFALLSLMVISPIRRLTAAADALRRGDLTARADLKGSGDIQRLGQTLDAMAGQLQSYTGGLERKVAERTVEISDANEKLRTLNLQLEGANRKLTELAVTDGLTGLNNYRFFMETLAFEVKRGERTPHAFALLMIDVDHFKQYNDTHGHPAGDEVLRSLARVFRSRLRGTDVVARYGGEEFAVLLLDTGVAEGKRVAEQIRGAVQAEGRRLAASGGAGVTISIGVAGFPGDGHTEAAVLAAADGALYMAKQLGRNRVEVAASSA